MFCIITDRNGNILYCYVLYILYDKVMLCKPIVFIYIDYIVLLCKPFVFTYIDYIVL